MIRFVSGRLAAVVAVLALSACATAESPPAAAPQPALLFVYGQSFDRDKMMAYSRALPPIYAANQGRYLALGGPGRGVEWHVAPWADRSAVLAVFPSAEARDGFWWSEDYRQAIRLRDRAGVFTVAGLDATEAALSLDPAGKAVFIVSTTGQEAVIRRLQTDMTGRLGDKISALTPPDGSSIDALEGDTLFSRVFAFAAPAERRAEVAEALTEALEASGAEFSLAVSVSGFAPPTPPQPPAD